MFFLGSLSTPLPYIILALIYLVSLVPGVAEKLALIDKQAQAPVTKPIAQIEISSDESISFDLATNFSKIVHNEVETICSAEDKIVQAYQIREWLKTKFLTNGFIALFETRFWPSIISRPPPVV
jgi:hypothetical protein